MRPIEGQRQFPVILGRVEREMLEALAAEDDRPMGQVIRRLIRSEFKRRQVATVEQPEQAQVTA